MTWTTPDDLRRRLRRVWDRGDVLAARVTGQSPFPLRIPLRRPAPRDVADRFGEVQDWVRGLHAEPFELELETTRNRVQGANALPVAALFPSEEEALRLLGKQAAARRFDALAEETLARHPSLRPWLARRPLVALAHADRWPELLAVVDWFRAHPRPDVYLRQLDVPGVDTKFVESHRGLLSELLDLVLPLEAVDPTATGAKGFARRYGLRSEPPLVRFRLLDPALFVHGLSDLSLPPEQFATLALPVRRVFVTENRTNGLAFPDHPGGMVVFGLGYGLDVLADVPWLARTDVRYWGDIDTHGFGILNRLRARLPHARSFLMDRATLEAHKPLWGQEPADKRHRGDPSHLTPEERELFDDLLFDRLGERVRLEQERVGFDRVVEEAAAPDR